MPNKSQSPIYGVDASVTIAVTNTWQRVLKEDNTRGSFTAMNVGQGNLMGLYFAPAGNNGKTPTPTGIGSPGVYSLDPPAAATGQGGSYEPDGGFIYQNEVWVIGTAADVLTVTV